ncbi:hypothetical protein [Advenella sp. FME57]|uniref:hypothetical protein n=1 Tax=Advenella sp. FME57 TaxID=2742604 RepID=UPI0018682461|nr:hypothetical protein [Advenella sp. FME57]
MTPPAIDRTRHSHMARQLRRHRLEHSSEAGALPCAAANGQGNPGMCLRLAGDVPCGQDYPWI